MKYDNRKNRHELFHCDNHGICQIIKRIPLSGPIKFLKLGRPGFEYNHDEKEFVLTKLYNYQTGKLQSSLQLFKNS